MRLDRRGYLLLSGAAALGGITAAGLARSVATAADVPVVARQASVPVAFLIDDKANVMDVAGPWETFQDNPSPGFKLYTVAPTKGPIRMTGGMKMVADHDFSDAPQPAVLVIGAQGWTDKAKIAWIREAAAKADVVMSVCTGAFLLAATGLIDGQTAATHHEYFEPFAEKYPTVRLVKGRRFVDNGKFVSAGGLTSGIDAALHVVSRYYGEAQAKGVAEYMEHDGEGWRTGVR